MHGRPITDADEKVSGVARYPADVDLPGMVHARLVLSPHAAATIAGVDTTAASEAPGVVAVLTAADLPTAGLPARDRNSAILATDRVVWQGQPVAVVVAETALQAADATGLVAVDYRPQPAVVDTEEAASPSAPLVWPEGIEKGEGASAEVHAGGAGIGGTAEAVGGNVVAARTYARGDVAAGFAQADEVVTLRFRTASVHQGYLEPHTVVAAADAFDGTLIVYSSTQGLFSTRNSVARLLGLRRDQVRVIPMTVGGGFGARYGIFEPLAAAVALAVGRPVKLTLSRSEDFVSTTPAPATVIEVRAGATRSGALCALEAKVLAASGAFAADLVEIIATLLGSVYRCDHLSIHAVEVLTNTSMAGAYRAPGAPQAAFALESTIDELCRALDVDPIAFRLGNAAETGDEMADGGTWPSIGLRPCLEAAAAHPMWQRRGALPDGHGIGVAAGGWPGGTAPAAAVCRADSDGIFYFHVGSVDITGTNTAFQLIAAEVLGIDPDDVRVINGDSSVAPQSGPSGGSMVTYTVGSAVREAAEGARQQILEIAAEMLEAAIDDLEIRNGSVAVKGSPGAEVTVRQVAAQGSRFGGAHPPIIAHGRSAITDQAPGFTVQLVEVAVDAETGRYRVVGHVVVQDVGKAINPPLVAGQIHGGAAQGLG
ncbi:MAG: xanthine dehydrogenase family protein molybdopterin-binding subunit, partial [Actinobacteria bacterium]